MKRRRLFIFLLLCFHNYFVSGQASTLLTQLNNTLDSVDYFDGHKFERIAQAKKAFSAQKDQGPAAQFDFYSGLYEEYKIFKFDTAFIYAKKLENLALSVNDPVKIAQAKLRLSFVLLSAGMYYETNELLSQVKVEQQPDSLKAAYYLLKGRYYYDLADYNDDNFFFPDYFKHAGLFLDSALQIFPANSFEHIYYSGLRQMKGGKMDEASDNFRQLLAKPDLSEHQVALTASTLSYIYFIRGENTLASNLQARAAIADIRSSTKETFAILNLSQLLFSQSDFASASRYIKKAVGDASFYGSRQRKIQLSTIMPIIQSSEINYIERERKYWIIYGIIVSLVLILFGFLLWTIRRQNSKLTKAKQEISNAHNKLHEINQQLQKMNSDLLSLNAKLEEANKIKEEYVGYFFTINAELFRKVERFKKILEQKVHYGKMDEIRYIVNSINIGNEKEELLKNFDRAFLKLFPHFVAEFNGLFNEEDRYNLPDDTHLNTDLRIYALIRLGIRENEKIAEILEYSIKSIYAYKTKIRNKARVPKDEFDKKVMEIQSL